MKLTLQEIDLDYIDKILFIEKQKIYMDSSIHGTSFELAITMKIVELKNKGIPLESYAMQKCYDKRTPWIQSLVKYVMRDEF